MKPDTQRVKARRHARGSAVALVAAAALAVLPAAGDATVTNVGSDLTKPANVVEAHGADALWWNSLIDGRPGAMPTDGQVTSVRVKGVVLDSPDLRRNPQRPDPMFHVQVLHPIGGGRVRVMLSSAPFRLPIVNVARDGTVQGNAQVINKYAPINLCVHRGDYVDFNEIGGHEWSWNFPGASPGLDGMHFQIFSAAPSSATPFYTKNAGTNNNSEWAPQDVRQGQELLMQSQLSTGAHATDFCPGGYMQHVFTGLQMSRGSATVSASSNTVKVRGSCSHKTYGGCKGVIVMKATIGGREVSLGGTAFTVRPAFSSTFNVKLSKQSIDMIKQAKSVTARVSADGHDDPLHDRRAKPGVPVQRKTTGTIFTLRAG
jgi:hypothetical protein